MFANLAGVLDFADSFEEKLNGLLKKITVEQQFTNLSRKVDEIQIMAHQAKVMEGFRCIEKAFKIMRCRWP